MRKHLLGACALALLTGCTTVGPNFTPPTTEATSYAMPGDQANHGLVRADIGDKVVADWWTLFHSPQLDAVMREAIANNRTLAAARARLAQARATAGEEGGLLNADLTAGIKRQRANLNAFSGGAFSGASAPGGKSFPTNPEFNLYSVGATVSYNLDLFGGVRRRREELAAGTEAQARELDAAYLALTGNIVEQALIIGDATIQIDTLKEIVANEQADLAAIKRAQAAGGASASDVAQAEGQIASDQSQIPAQRQRISAASHQMAVLVGKSPSDFTPPVFDAASAELPEILPVLIPSALVHGRPDILEAEARLHAATADVGVATAALYPNITLSGSLSQDALTAGALFNPIATSWAIGGGLTAPLFHSGELKARQSAAKAAREAALATYEETVLEAFAQVDDVLQAIVHDNQSYADQLKALDATTARLDMVRKAQKLGGASARQVLTADRDWRKMKLALQRDGSGRYADAARLLLATATVPPGVAEGRK
jgi:NodT family efflux transporter outer membrane factor (OMF) lipoprotein